MERTYRLFYFFCAAILVLILNSISIFGVQNETTPISDYKGAREFMDPILVGVGGNCQTIYQKEDGTYGGYGFEMLKKVSDETGLIFIYQFDERASLVKRFESGELDILMGNNQSLGSREAYMLSEPLEQMAMWICSNGQDYQSLLDLENRQTGFIAGQGSFETFRDLYDVRLRPVFFDDAEAMVKGLVKGEIEAVMLNDCVVNNQLLSDYGIVRNFELQNLQVSASLVLHKEDMALLDTLNYYMIEYEDSLDEMKENAFSDFIREELRREGIEEPFVNGEPIVVGIIQDYLPYDYIKGGDYYGVSAEVVTLLGDVLMRQIIPVAYEDRQTLLEDFEAGKVDLVPSASIFDVKGIKDAGYSSAYSSSNVAVVGEVDSRKVIYRLFDLEDSVIALEKGSWQEQLLVNNRVNFMPVYVGSIHEAMDMVNSGTAEYCMDTALAMSFLTRSYKYKQLTTVSELEIMDRKYFLYHSSESEFGGTLNSLIAKMNHEKLEMTGIEGPYESFYGYDIFAILTILLFVFLIGVGIYVLILINRLNTEKRNAQLANDSKSEFLAKMSHEIRTPLTAVLGYVNLVSRSETLTETEKNQLNIAKNSSNILLNLVNDILDFSKIEAGKMQIVNHPFNVKAMIDNVANIIQISAENKQLDFRITVSEDLPDYVVGDERRLEQVLINILSNAIKFTDAGHIDLNVGASIYRDYVRINFTVGDTGKGMDQKKLATVFEAFEQEDNSISRAYGGTGLGLYISKEFVMKMGGEIYVNSEVGKGTVFKFHTIHQKSDNPLASGREIGMLTTEHLIGKKVLLAEDNDINQMIIKDILMSMGLKVVVTANGREALEIASDSFDYIFLDIQMPVLDGITTVKMMRQKSVLDQVPIIALTANVLAEQIESYYEAGFDGFCSKPIDVNELGRILLEHYR